MGQPGFVGGVDPIDTWCTAADLQWWTASLSPALLSTFTAVVPVCPKMWALLVEKLEATRTVVRLVNLNPNEGRELIIQAGGFGEHRFGTSGIRRAYE